MEKIPQSPKSPPSTSISPSPGTSLGQTSSGRAVAVKKFGEITSKFKALSESYSKAEKDFRAGLNSFSTKDRDLLVRTHSEIAQIQKKILSLKMLYSRAGSDVTKKAAICQLLDNSLKQLEEKTINYSSSIQQAKQTAATQDKSVDKAWQLIPEEKDAALNEVEEKAFVKEEISTMEYEGKAFEPEKLSLEEEAELEDSWEQQEKEIKDEETAFKKEIYANYDKIGDPKLKAQIAKTLEQVETKTPEEEEAELMKEFEMTKEEAEIDAKYMKQLEGFKEIEREKAKQKGEEKAEMEAELDSFKDEEQAGTNAPQKPQEKSWRDWFTDTFGI